MTTNHPNFRCLLFPMSILRGAWSFYLWSLSSDDREERELSLWLPRRALHWSIARWKTLEVNIFCGIQTIKNDKCDNSLRRRLLWFMQAKSALRFHSTLMARIFGNDGRGSENARHAQLGSACNLGKTICSYAISNGWHQQCEAERLRAIRSHPVFTSTICEALKLFSRGTLFHVFHFAKCFIVPLFQTLDRHGCQDPYTAQQADVRNTTTSPASFHRC
jgi:hypothetical protein